MDDILARLKGTEDPKPAVSSANSEAVRPKAVNNILASLNDQLKKQQEDLESGLASTKEVNGSSDSDLFTPASETFSMISAGPSSQPDMSRAEVEEMIRLKEELASAKSIITRQDQELTETRNLKHTIDQAMGPPSDAEFGHRDPTDPASGTIQGNIDASARPFNARQDPWLPTAETRSDYSDTYSNVGHNRGRGVWNNQPQQQPVFANGLNTGLHQQPPLGDGRSGYFSEQSLNQSYGNSTFPSQGNGPTSQRILSGPIAPTYAMDGRYTNEQAQYTSGGGSRRSTSQYSRPGSSFSNRNNFYNNYGPSTSSVSSTGSVVPLGYGSAFGYHPRPIGTPLSPTATEFTTTGSTLSGTTLASLGGPWSSVSCF